MNPILQAVNLSKTFSQPGASPLAAVEQVSFSLYPGEILGIVGESGSGKSTVAKLLTRLEQPTQGKILLNGQDITHLRGAALTGIYRTMQMVFQTPAGSFDPRRTLGDGIRETLCNQGLSRKEAAGKAVDLLAQCGLDASFARRYPHEVSGGECQRAAIARALAAEPQILILDEATASLDVTVQQQILDLLQSLHRQRQISYLFICHNLALVQQLCHRVLVMQGGKIVEEGVPDDIISHPVTEYTRLLIRSVFS